MNPEQQTKVKEALRRSLLVPVFYHENYEVCEAVMKLCFEEGIELFEFTNRGSNAAATFEKLQQLRKKSYPDNFLGIGTIKTAQEAEAFVKLEPSFVVSPIVNTKVGAVCEANQIPWMPGCITPTEVFEATSNGASVIKIFPASLVGPSYIKALKAVFPDISIMPTGGIRAEKEILQNWFDAGVLCVGMGSELIERDLIQKKDWTQLREKLKQARKVITSCIS
jgi:2-dehydro-3-deoxyphosphogluconate aldolase/(4S)-4-hydroxy-2-oxoglutarate aldolase